jgi:beta-lactam-binding protein with PASTA domain
VPKLLGQNIEKVKAQAKEAGYTLKIIWTAIGETDEYVVLSQNPASGTKIKPGDAVTVTVNH